MEKLSWHNSEFDESDIVILGIPDESRSHSLREGTALAPDKVREISNQRDSYKRSNHVTKALPFAGISKKVHDFGNIKRDQIPDIFLKIMDQGKIPISIGGDHSITTSIIDTISQKFEKISLVYFDAHPDFITSTKNYYGSVFGDVLNHLDKSTSLQIGTRTPELEELNNLKENQIVVITPLDLEKNGIDKISKQILDIIGDNTYISFDMDCIDPAFAPGVSVPVPLGLTSLQAQGLLKKIVQKGIIGADFVEVCPPFDVDDRTSHLASRLIAELISSVK